MLLKVAADFESEVRRLVKRLMGLLEPGHHPDHGPRRRLHRGRPPDGHLLPDGGRPMTRARLAREGLEGQSRLHPHRDDRGRHHPRPARGPGRPAAVRPRRAVQDGRRARADRAARRRPRPVQPRRRRLPALVGRPRSAGAESERRHLERAVSQEERRSPPIPGAIPTSTSAVPATTASTISGATARTASPAARGRTPTSLRGTLK